MHSLGVQLQDIVSGCRCYFVGVKWPGCVGVLLTADLHLVLRSGMVGATPLLPCVLSWHREGHVLLQDRAYEPGMPDRM